MRNFFLLLLSLFLINIVSAQDIKPVQFHFSANFINDSTCQLQIGAKIEKGNALFSAIKQTPDDAFISQLLPDSSLMHAFNADEKPEEI